MSDPITARRTGTTESSSRPGEPQGDAPIGSPEHLRVAFARAASAIDRAMGVWLARYAAPVLADWPHPSDRGSDDIRGLRALVRTSATTYVRQLKQDDVPPERMVVLVKQAVGHPRIQGFSVQELTSELVLWSIEAYFDD